jgi:Rer1 family
MPNSETSLCKSNFLDCVTTHVPSSSCRAPALEAALLLQRSRINIPLNFAYLLLLVCVFCRTYQHWLDKSVIYHRARWASFVGILLLYLLRVYFINGWFIVTYGLGIFLLNNFIGFLSPQVRCSAAICKHCYVHSIANTTNN